MSSSTLIGYSELAALVGFLITFLGWDSEEGTSEDAAFASPEVMM
jgi:hypothetical protein